jgi:hypothetical protein
MANNSLEKYNSLMVAFNARTSFNKYYFEFTKCCGFSFLMLFFRDYTLEDMYRNTQLEMGFNNIKLFVQNAAGLRLEIPRDSNVAIREFIADFPSYFVPVYPMPANVVYSIVIDDGHEHLH